MRTDPVDNQPAAYAVVEISMIVTGSLLCGA